LRKFTEFQLVINREQNFAKAVDEIIARKIKK